jgi:hypothetical protein
MKITNDDIQDRLDEYKTALRKETQASPLVRINWRKMVCMFEELLARREEERLRR